ncbi:cupin domain-containing protein [Paenibacillus sp. FSL W7-1287]|uniref:cupin domain-containing protein n=1 Tax=Paenibacillus sp. FSL W7-1287 TaxID=2954538 RepID=UPI0030F8815B
MFSPYERDRYCPPIQWYWNGSHWSCVSYPVDSWRYSDWSDAVEQAEQTYRDVVIKDYGPNPLVINIEDASEQNTYFRNTLWTGNHLQLVLMSLRPGEEIGLEKHDHTDQFLRLEEGQGLVKMGNSPNDLSIQRYVREDDSIVVPAGTWHNLINTGNKTLKLYTLYAPPEHPFGTVQQTRPAATASASMRKANKR